jgi:hypothetical protein
MMLSDNILSAVVNKVYKFHTLKNFQVEVFAEA